MQGNRSTAVLALAGLLATACGGDLMESASQPNLAVSGAPQDGPGAVYLMSNTADGNAIIVFDRSADGQLTQLASYPTGGRGTGGGLGNQVSLILTADYRYLYAVNAASNDISAFAVRANGLELVSAPVWSGGKRPVSLAVHGDLLYVLNAGSDGNIAGFRIESGGVLTPIAGASRPLSSSASAAAQIQFNRDGRVLVVTERATNVISTYTVGANGIAYGPKVHPSAGETPFGFNFNQRGNLVVSEAAGGADGASSASSYRVGSDGALTLITGPVATTQTAACWIAISADGRFAYTANTGSGTLSSLSIHAGGTLSLADAVAAETGPASRPQDAAFTPGGRFLYVRNAGGFVGAFRVEDHGGLTHLGDFGPLPDGANGIAAR